MNKDLLLFGGGLDSAALALWLKHKKGVVPTLLHVDYGQKAMIAERLAMYRIANRLGAKAYELTTSLRFSAANIMSGGIGSEPKANKLELRNVVLVSLAASWAATYYDNYTLYLGFHHEPEGAPFPDANIEWIGAMNQVLAMASTTQGHIEAPLHRDTRLDIYRIGLALDAEVMEMAHTCYEVTTCGKCTHCRQLAEMRSKL